MQIGDVFSAFDGLSGAQVALNQAGIKYGTYKASEVDKYTIQITQKNYPKTVQLGDIRHIKGKDLGNIYLMIGGSPCKGFSFATNGRLNFAHPESKLFFEFVRLLKEIKPRYFLLENVRMANKHKKIISDYLGVEPIEINSSLLSAQRRLRLYWTNIPGVKQPEDLEIILGDILESDATEPMYSNIYGGFKEKKPREHYNKSVTIRTASGGGHIPSVTKKINKSDIRKLTPREAEALQTLPDNYTEGVSDTQRYKMIGNGFTTLVIAHILSYMEDNPKPLKFQKQLELL
jgi:DNA (cytosine-5)-methyltransferase 3A